MFQKIKDFVLGLPKKVWTWIKAKVQFLGEKLVELFWDFIYNIIAKIIEKLEDILEVIEKK